MQTMRVLITTGAASVVLFASALAFAQTTNVLVDGAGHSWDIHDLYGRIEAGEGGTFDGFGELYIDDVRYENTGGAGELLAVGRSVSFPAVTLSSLDVSRRVFVSETAGVARLEEWLHNPTGADITVDVELRGDLGLDSALTVAATSSGDLVADIDDTWIVLDDAAPGTPFAVGLAFNGNGPNQPTALTLTAGDGGPEDLLTLTWGSVTVPAGETVLLLTLVNQNNNADGLPTQLEGYLPIEGTAAGAELATDDLVLLHNFPIAPGAFTSTTMEYGVNSGGSLILPALDLGLRPTGDGDWLLETPAYEAWSVGTEFYSIANRQPYEADEVGFYLRERSTLSPDYSCTQFSWTDDIEIEQTVTHVDGSSLVRVDVTLTNVSGGSLPLFQYMRSVDPDPDALHGGSTATTNDVIDDVPNGVVVTAVGPFTDRALVLATGDDGVIGTALPAPWSTVPVEVVAAHFDPDGTTEDAALFLVWDFGTFAPGATETTTFWYAAAASLEDALLAVSDEGIDIPNITDRDGDGRTIPTDCDDDSIVVFPGAAEFCDGVDNNCNGEIDEGLTTTYYEDADGDGHGTAEGETVESCLGVPEGYSALDDDCNDRSAAAYPGAEEICDDVDNDCDGELNEDVGDNTFYFDGDGDGFGGITLTITACTPPVGYSENNDDCDDTRVDVHPAAAELCDGIDNNCNDIIDEDTVGVHFYLDADGDGRGDPETQIEACVAPEGYVRLRDDCDDDDPNNFPTNTEVCDGQDNDCDEEIDEDGVCSADGDADGDGDGDGDGDSDGDSDGDGDGDSDGDGDGDSDGDADGDADGDGLRNTDGCSCSGAGSSEGGTLSRAAQRFIGLLQI